jgi:predicted nucleotidyltransferase
MNNAIEKQNAVIKKIMESLIEVYKPIEIYIFGSYAWGTPNEESDIDFAVIINSTDLDMADRIRLSGNVLWGIGVPADILVFTKAEIEEKSMYNSTLQHRIIHEGTKIYEAA